MLMQIRPHTLRLITQHHHALLSGQLAFAWQGVPGDEQQLPWESVLATTMHDWAWQNVDTKPLWNQRTKRPHDFISYPVPDKVALYQRGLTVVSDVHPYAGYLGSLHYTAFSGTKNLTVFQQQEKQRRQVLETKLSIDLASDHTWRKHLYYLQLFDNLSLLICLAPPSAIASSRPRWLDPLRFAKTFRGIPLTVSWQDDSCLQIDPFPFSKPLTIEIVYRELADKFDNDQHLQHDWQKAAQKRWQFTIQSSKEDYHV